MLIVITVINLLIDLEDCRSASVDLLSNFNNPEHYVGVGFGVGYFVLWIKRMP